MCNLQCIITLILCQTDIGTVHAPLSAALNKSRTPKENMLTFVFYFIFELKLDPKLRQNSKKSVALNGDYELEKFHNFTV